MTAPVIREAWPAALGLCGAEVRGLSLWEPWASLMAVGAKRIETRSWETKYRGPVLICASARRVDHRLLSESEYGALFAETLRPGYALVLVDLVDCCPTEDMGPREIGSDRPFGDFSAGRYAWITCNRRRLEPFPFKGSQRLFRVSPRPVALWGQP